VKTSKDPCSVDEDKQIISAASKLKDLVEQSFCCCKLAEADQGERCQELSMRLDE
jgi:hypothetical protein